MDSEKVKYEQKEQRNSSNLLSPVKLEQTKEV